MIYLYCSIFFKSFRQNKGSNDVNYGPRTVTIVKRVYDGTNSSSRWQDWENPKKIAIDSVILVKIPTCTRKDCGELNRNICVGGKQGT